MKALRELAGRWLLVLRPPEGVTAWRGRLAAHLKNSGAAVHDPKADSRPGAFLDDDQGDMADDCR